MEEHGVLQGRVTLALENGISRCLNIWHCLGIHLAAQNARRKLVLLAHNTTDRIRIAAGCETVHDNGTDGHQAIGA
ncbi:hypothetical protein D3C77_778870 [compost metagenome]